MARGKHLFPFRTEQLSPSAPMVLGSQEPGRVGRRRFLLAPAGPAQGPLDVFLPSRARRTRLARDDQTDLGIPIAGTRAGVPAGDASVTDCLPASAAASRRLPSVR